jgi:hypothetical protein
MGKHTPHELQDFSPTSRFHPGEVQQLVSELKAVPFVFSPGPFAVPPSIAAAIHRADTEREVIQIRRKELSNELFAQLFSSDDPYPLLIVPDPGEKIFQYLWDADFFARVFGDTRCEIEDCTTGIKFPSTVGDFFRCFGEYPTEQVLRLKVVPLLLRFVDLELTECLV